METKFFPSGRGKAQCPPDPDFPNGKALPALPGVKCCQVSLPYPAPECGSWLVHCEQCGSTGVVTAAGRPDDPVSFFLPCTPSPAERERMARRHAQN